ncbi:MAG: O-methyltransferase [Caldilineaceae bacterium]|nr:O-methyltransferase [Caldilineaceae bacterium]
MSDTINYARLQEYLETLVPPRDAELVRMEEYAREHDFPIIGPTAGYVCYQTARLIGARRVYELGSGYGYSTAWFARAVHEHGGGEVHHVVWDEKLSSMARQHLDALGYGDLIRYHVGEAVAALRTATGPFDLIFMDIQKSGYPGALPFIEAQLRPGGVLLVDNVLWSGRVMDEEATDADTQAIRQMTQALVSDPGWLTTITPVRDGLLLAYRA